MSVFKQTPKVPDLIENRIVEQASLELDEFGHPNTILIKFQDTGQVHSLWLDAGFDAETVLAVRQLANGGVCQTTCRWYPDEFGTYRAHFGIVKIRAGTPNPNALSLAEGNARRAAIPRSKGFELTANNAAGLACSALAAFAVAFCAFTVWRVIQENPREAPINIYETPYPNRPRVPATGPVPLRPSPPPAETHRPPPMVF